MSNTLHKPKRSRYLIKSFQAEENRRRNLTERIADNLTRYFGTISFLIVNVVFFSSWIIINIGLIPNIPVFDPFPFILLINFVSLEAIVLAIVVLMSQNRESQTATLRDELQLQVELITEREITKTLFLLNQLLKSNNINIDDKELDEMLSNVDSSYITKKLEDQLKKQ